MKVVGVLALAAVASAHDFTVCKGTTDTMAVSGFTLSPDPAEKGRDLTVSFTATPKEEFTSGKVAFNAKVFGVELPEMDFDVCKDLGIQCPMKAGVPVTGKITYKIPEEAPAGITADVELKFEDKSGSTLSCIDSKVEVAKPKLFGMPKKQPMQEMQFLFTQFVKQHKKEYETADFFKRFNIFVQNWEKIVEHNKSGRSWTQAMNHFGDLTPEEFKQFKTGFYGRHNSFLRSQNAHVHDGSPLADSVDWRTKNAVTHVKNQGQCGSCWAFSTTGSTEGAHAIKSGKLVSLAEQQLVDCSKSEGNNGCNGGLMDYGFEYIIKNGGIGGEDAYPYTASDGMCKKTPSVATISSYKDVTQGSEDDLKSALNIGPVSIAIEADQSGFQFYSGGVFDGTCGQQLDHGVLAVGYGTDASSSKDFWIVKNSWGEQWGEEGYIRLVRGQNQCGIADAGSYPIV